VLCENPNWLPLHFRQLKAAFGKYSLAHTLWPTKFSINNVYTRRMMVYIFH
jgi:hypothetical protein